MKRGNIFGPIVIGASLGLLPANAQVLAGKTAAAAAIATPKISYYHPDHLGSSSVLTDFSGAKIQQIAYLPYGKEKSPLDFTKFLPIHRFTGQIKDDETGLNFYNARYYDAELGRFTQADSVVPDPEDPQALNRYSYVYNNPLKYSDPTGHIPYLPGILQGLAQYNQSFFSSYFRPQIDWDAMPARPSSTAEKLSSIVPNYDVKGSARERINPHDQLLRAWEGYKTQLAKNTRYHMEMLSKPMVLDERGRPVQSQEQMEYMLSILPVASVGGRMSTWIRGRSAIFSSWKKPGVIVEVSDDLLIAPVGSMNRKAMGYPVRTFSNGPGTTGDDLLKLDTVDLADLLWVTDVAEVSNFAKPLLLQINTTPLLRDARALGTLDLFFRNAIKRNGAFAVEPFQDFAGVFIPFFR